MASREDAEAGWELFKDSDYTLSLAEINRLLVRQGDAPVSSRMYEHYRKLLRYGYESYLPINQLDVKTLQDPVWDRAIRGRYLLLPFTSPVVLRLLVDAEVVQFDGVATQLSEGRLVVRLDDHSAVAFFGGIVKTEPLAEIEFPEEGELLLGQIERITLDNANLVATVRLSLLEPAPSQRLTGRPPVGGAAIELRLPNSDDDLSLASLVQVLYWTLQGLEASRICCQELLSELDPDNTLDLPPPRVVSVSMNSPLRALLDVAWPYGVVFLGVWRTYVKLSKEYWDKEISKETASRLRFENDQRGIERRFRPKPVLEAMTSSLKKAIRDAGRTPAVEEPSELERVVTIIEKQLLPAIRELDRATKGQLYLESQDREPLEIAAIAPPAELELPPGEANDASKAKPAAKKKARSKKKKRK